MSTLPGGIPLCRLNKVSNFKATGTCDRLQLDAATFPVIHAPAHPGSHSLSVVIVSHREARHHLAKAITNRQHLEEMSRCVSLPSSLPSPLSAWPCALHFRRLIAQQKLQLNTSKSLLQTNKPQPKVRAKQTEHEQQERPKDELAMPDTRYAIHDTRYKIQDTRCQLSDTGRQQQQQKQQ